LATGRAFQTASDQASKIAEDEYEANLAAVNSRYATNVGAGVTQRGQDLNTTLAAYGLAPSLEAQQFTPGQAESAVGTAQQQQAQNELNDVIAKYYYNQPGVARSQSQQILALLGGLPGGGLRRQRFADRADGWGVSGAVAEQRRAHHRTYGAGIGAVGGCCRLYSS
jgi:hypothetical protein